LASTAQTLLQNIKYEIPALSKAISSHQTQIQELRRQNNHRKNALDQKIQLETACKEMNITESSDIQQGLLKLASIELPLIYTLVTEQIQSPFLEQAVSFLHRMVYFHFFKIQQRPSKDN